MRGQKGLFPSRAHRNCLTWSDKMTAVHHLHQQQHQWYSSAGGRWGRNTGMQQKSISPLTLKGNIWHVPTALDVFSVSLQSLDMQKYPSAVTGSEKNPCAHGLRRRWSDIPVMRMEKPKQNHRPWSTRAIGMITARVSHQISHTRKTRVMKKRRTKGERDGERRGRWRERARARVCAFTSVDQSKCTVC